jgi:DNA-binding winged helix-turn-helix (wHTH) protein
MHEALEDPTMFNQATKVSISHSRGSHHSGFAPGFQFRAVNWGSYSSGARAAVHRQEPAGASEFRFGRFRMLPLSRALLCEGRPVACGSRAFDLLHVLLLSRGTVVTKEAIVKHVWPNTLVEESNLRFQMGSLRRVLGPDRDLIKTVPGRGYLMAVELETV